MRDRPMYSAALLLALGMAASHFFIQSHWVSLGYLLIVTAVFACRSCLTLTMREYLLACSIIFGGGGYYFWYDVSNQSVLKESAEEILLTGEIVSAVEVDGDVVKFRMALMELQGKRIEETAEVRIFLKSEEEQKQARKLSYGMLLQLPARLKRPEPGSNPGSFDYREFLYYKRIHWTLHSSSWSAIKVKPPSLWRADVWAYKLRAYLELSMDHTFPPGSSDIMKTLLLGIKGVIPEEISDLYADTGLIHVLAISGLHMTIIAGGILGTLRFIGLTRETSILITLAIIPTYAILAGAAPSIVRSGIMAMVSLIGVYLHRPRDGLNLWGIALFLMLLYNPYHLWDIGFQLSFLVTWGLIMFVPTISGYFHYLPASISSLLAVAVTAQLVSFPLTVYYFHQYHFLSLVINLLFVPLFSVIVIPIGFVLFMLGIIHPGLVQLWTESLGLFLALVNETLKKVTEGQAFLYYMASPSIWWLAIYYIVLYSGLWIIKGRKLLWICSMTGLVAFLLFLPLQGNKVKITFLDVGQGDAIVVQLPKNKVYLIDGGGVLNYDREESWRVRKREFDPGKNVIIPFLKAQGINEVHTLAITHGDLDHIGGLASVAAEIPIRRVLVNGALPASEEETSLYAFFRAKRIPLYQGSRGIAWTDADGIHWRILHPGAGSNYSDNDRSLVLLLEAYGFRVLFTGDLEEKGEEELLEQQILEKIHVLKVAHHGSNSSTTSEWLHTAQPDFSVISAGRNNRYGHPHQEVLNRIKDINSGILRTDQHGAVTVEISLNDMKVWTYLQPLGRPDRQKDHRGGNSSD
ncbi:DNA internalization-related competence protein ComEC/Rec2 [Ammoniphilus sp. 3BR4]|uniref:DNA internalization-related competence protein ComEC/Rec2 n=1 Tax=Ammoniphilus sp. 3BR4 TaxID=3158265 RepID=UPI003466D7AC